uniref:acylphosphatase n=1 Tax=uncultured Sphingomonas sp. TaxID=158754 RepID=UPI0035CAA642
MAVVQRVFVSGKVQRVGYRDWAVRTALKLGVTGWVRNLHDGRIEMLLAGDDAAIAAMTDACREGPAPARVDHVDTRADDERAPKGFTRRFTA